MNNSFHNRRKFHRINFAGQVNLEFGDEQYECCQIKNLSLTGMYVSGNFKQKQAENCHISFVRDGNTERKYLQASGKVVWGNEGGVGVQFTSMKLDHYQSLKTLLINNAEQPVIILSQLPNKCPFEISNM